MLLGEYQNGNYTVLINGDGTKIRKTEEDSFIPEFAESMDMTITEYCDGNCPWCYAGCSLEGKHCDFSKYDKLLNSLHPYTELAINGNDLSHPQLEEFLTRMKKQKVIVNMTVNQLHFERKIDYIRSLVNRELIHGLGISLRNATPEFVTMVREFPNAIIHVINGLFTVDDLKVLMMRNLKLLILGYKDLGRGIDYKNATLSTIKENQKWLFDNLWMCIGFFKCVAFDNLALEQLYVRRLFTDEQWEKTYMGDEATFTFFINLVQGYYAGSSLIPEHHLIGDKTIDEMFADIKENKNEYKRVPIYI